MTTLLFFLQNELYEPISTIAHGYCINENLIIKKNYTLGYPQFLKEQINFDYINSYFWRVKCNGNRLQWLSGRVMLRNPPFLLSKIFMTVDHNGIFKKEQFILLNDKCFLLSHAC
jgi:hypothetical protein